jgi:hypothetical protein
MEMTSFPLIVRFQGGSLKIIEAGDSYETGGQAGYNRTKVLIIGDRDWCEISRNGFLALCQAMEENQEAIQKLENWQ